MVTSNQNLGWLKQRDDRRTTIDRQLKQFIRRSSNVIRLARFGSKNIFIPDIAP